MASRWQPRARHSRDTAGAAAAAGVHGPEDAGPRCAPGGRLGLLRQRARRKPVGMEAAGCTRVFVFCIKRLSKGGIRRLIPPQCLPPASSRRGAGPCSQEC